jgi:C1A family cysteine protease
MARRNYSLFYYYTLFTPVIYLMACVQGTAQDWQNTIGQLRIECPKGSKHVYEENSGEIIELPTSRGGSSAPAKFSLKEHVPPAIDQIGGSCVSFASAYYGMTTYLRKEQKNNELEPCDPMNLHTRIHAFLNTCDEIDDGSTPTLALTLLRDFGISTTTKFDSVLMNCEMIYPLQEYPTKLNTWKKLNNSFSNLENIKYAISKGNPIMAGISTNLSLTIYHSKYWKSFKPIAKNLSLVTKEDRLTLIAILKQLLPDDCRGYTNKDILREFEKTADIEALTDFCWQGKLPLENQGPHAICIIGYDNNRYGGAFEVVNSWGSEWGNDGYLWIKYSDFYKMFPSFFMIGN